MTIAKKLASIKSSKESIKKAIQAKGVSCGDKLSDYSARIQAIPTAKLQIKNFNITENGSVTITPDSGNDGISGGIITVNVPSSTTEKFTVYNGMKFRGDWTQSSTSKMDFSNVTSTESMFQECLFSGATSFNFTFSRASQNRMTFYQATFGSGTTVNAEIAGITGNPSCDYTFAYSSVDTVNLKLLATYTADTGYFISDLNNTFHGCTASTIGIELYNADKTIDDVYINSLSDTFKGCTNLVNLTLSTNIRFAAELDLSECTKLSEESILGVAHHLNSSSFPVTLTISQQTYAILDEVGKEELESAVESAGWALVIK